MTLLSRLAAGAALAAIASTPALAQQYVSGSAGFNFQADSDNRGAFTRDFTTGDGVAVPAGAVLPRRTDARARTPRPIRCWFRPRWT